LRSLSWRTRAVYVKHQAHLTWQEKRHDSSINTMFWNLGQHNCYEIYRPGHQYTNTILQINITSQSRVTVPRKIWSDNEILQKFSIDIYSSSWKSPNILLTSVHNMALTNFDRSLGRLAKPSNAKEKGK
jgi:hypothetical protein